MCGGKWPHSHIIYACGACGAKYIYICVYMCALCTYMFWLVWESRIALSPWPPCTWAAATRGCACNSLILRCSHLFAFACVCLCLLVFVHVCACLFAFQVPFQLVCVCACLFAFVCVCKHPLLLDPPFCSTQILDGPNRQSPIASVQRTRPILASHSILQFHVERIPHQWTPIARFESQRNETRGLWGPNPVFCDNYRAISPI